MIVHADIRRVQEWMGHADIQTTMRYLHYAPRREDAELVARAFALAQMAGSDRLSEIAKEPDLQAFVPKRPEASPSVPRAGE